MDTLKFICGEWRLDQELERMEKYCCEEMFKKFYQWMVDFNLGYYGEQEDEKVFLQYIVIYNLLQKMVVVDIGYYR